MPIYEYICQECQATTEALRKMDEADAPIRCEKCGSKKTRRAHSVFAPSAGSAKDSAMPTPRCGMCPNAGACGLE